MYGKDLDQFLVLNGDPPCLVLFYLIPLSHSLSLSHIYSVFSPKFMPQISDPSTYSFFIFVHLIDTFFNY
ncbi:hypothetical protein LguiA_029894 [Lonicera macranthoides]